MTCEEITARIAVLEALNIVYEATITATKQAIAANETEIAILWLNYEAQDCGPLPSSSSSSSSSLSSSSSSSSS